VDAGDPDEAAPGFSSALRVLFAEITTGRRPDNVFGFSDFTIIARLISHGTVSRGKENL